MYQPFSRLSPKFSRNIRDHLEHFPLFHGLNETDYTFIASLIEWRNVASSVTIIHQGHTCSGLFLLVNGTVKVYFDGSDSWTKSDKQNLITVCQPGDILGEIDIADGKGHTASVRTREECTFFWTSSENFWLCHNAIPQIGRNLSSILATRLRQSTVSCEILSTMHLAGRVAHQLLRLEQDYGVRQVDDSILISIKLSQAEMAGLVGSSRGAINRIICNFKEQGYIDMKRDSSILILNRNALNRLCHGFISSASTALPKI